MSPAWGVVYRIRDSDLGALDKQKGVGSFDPKYKRIHLTVKTSKGESFNAFTYVVRESKRMAQQQLPSVQYRACILKGARLNRLPKAYTAALTAIEDNGNRFKRKSVGHVCG
jgi:cation transport regulator ChaC